MILAVEENDRTHGNVHQVKYVITVSEEARGEPSTTSAVFPQCVPPVKGKDGLDAARGSTVYVTRRRMTKA